MSIHVSGIIYAIIREGDGKLIKRTFPLSLDHEPSPSELCQHFNYSINLATPGTSDLGRVNINTSSGRQNFNFTRSQRRIAFAFQQTAARIEEEHDVVAISHRRGGWKTFIWKYNDDISFEIYSNFGYGSSSELISRFYYKGIPLTPYSDYVRYRFANYTQLIRYTYTYRLEYSEWNKLMNETLVFYNAVCENKENEVFNWMKRHLRQMLSGLEMLLSKSEYWFHRPNDSSVRVTGYELEEVRAEKLGGAVEFIGNIKLLPTQVGPEEYIGKILNLLDRYLSHAGNIENELTNSITTIKEKIERLGQEPVLSIYDRLYKRHYAKEKWHDPSHTVSMLRYLLTLHYRMGRPFSKETIREQIARIPNLLKERANLSTDLSRKQMLLDTIQKAVSKIKDFRLTSQLQK